MAKKLWQTKDNTSAIASLVNSYTVGNDYIVDSQLLPYDIKASLAHASMLKQLKVISNKELNQLSKGLNEILAKWQSGKFKITQGDEDVHTAIENYLIGKLGSVGKKIHTGRSRNDQVLVILRLYSKQRLAEILTAAKQLFTVADKLSQKYQDIPMPGYTHMQPAMPTKVGTWLGSFADAYTDAVEIAKPLQKLLDQNPLGSGAGFGIPKLALKPSITTKLLGFNKTQVNPMYAGLSRGLFESAVLNSLSPLMIVSGRFASDMLLFTTKEFGFFSLPQQFTTGSSIMPQKRNYDVFEIMRANAHIYLGYQQQVQSISTSIGSGFQRDLQLTKQPFIAGMELIIKTLEVLEKALSNLKVDSQRLQQAMTEDLYVTDKVYELVKKGVPFREAYQKVKKELQI